MRQLIFTIFYQFDPYNSSIGGIQTCIKYFIKYAPQEFEVRLVGTSSDPALPLGKWHEAELDGRAFLFMPVLYIENDNVRGLIPTTVKYTMALLKQRFTSDFLQFYRIEPTLAASNWQGQKILYIQNDIDQAVKGASREGGILWRRFPRAYFALERRLVGQLDRVFCCNSKSAERYQQRYPQLSDRISYVPNTVDGELFYPLSTEERDRQRARFAKDLGLPEDTQFILFAGRLHPQKQPLLLIRSIAALKRPKAHLLVVGQGELETEMRAEIARLQLSQQVTLLGPLEQSKLADLYRICYLFVLTSAYEGLAFGSIEALACGTPVVTTRAGETPNFLTADSGVVCDEQTPDAIANALKQVLEQPERYPAEACARVARPYSARSAIGNVYRNLFQEWEQLQ